MSDAPTLSADHAGTIPLLRRLFAEHGRQHLKSYIGAGCLMAVGAVATAISAWLLKPVLNGMVEAEGFRTLRLLAWAVAGLFILRGLATYGYLVVLSRTGNKIVAGVQTRLFDHLLRQDMRFFQDRHSTDFMARLALAANGVRDTLQVLITSMGRDVLTLAGLIAVMILQDPLMAVMALSVMPVGGYFLGRLIRTKTTPSDDHSHPSSVTYSNDDLPTYEKTKADLGKIDARRPAWQYASR